MTDPVPVLSLPVEVTREEVPALEARALECTGADGSRLVIDLEQVYFLSSAGLGFLVKLSKTLHDRGGAIALARPRPAIGRILRSVGLDRVLPSFPDLDSAQAHLSGTSR